MDKKYLVQNRYYPTIGIECHVQLKTKTKLFAGVDNDAREASPNTLISPLCIGMPGTLPVLNAAVIPLSIRAGLALRATISPTSHFDRKHYFYPDLPKGYQITQYERPIVVDGTVEAPMLDGSYVTVGIERAHLEEDAGKSSHPTGETYSLVDLNRAGTPLLEIVSAPDMHSAEEARAYVHELYLLMKYADVSDVDLYHGNMRFDVNVSVSTDPKKLGTRSETKNLNSFKSVEKAVEYEIKRQIRLLEEGQSIVQETRGWDDDTQQTVSQRSKEDAHDYRYFPDPDIPPITVAQEAISYEAQTMPLLPAALREQFGELGLDTTQISTIIELPIIANIVRVTIEQHDTLTAKTIAHWCVGEITKLVADNKMTWQQVQSAVPLLVALASMQNDNKMSSSAAKGILTEMITTNTEPMEVAKKHDLLQVSDEGELVLVVERVLAENKKAALDVRNGELKAIGFLVGQVMKASAGKANPAIVQQLIKKQLGVK
ncbi:MAG: Asp-tRNA(Asn)/Glu-tRNA(Gln) amidotransferase subunit GatB [Candidatus Saccharimonadales bacterium]